MGGHECITINDLIKLIEEYTGQKAKIEQHPRHPADAMANQADVTRAGQLLGWEPQVSLREGVAQLVDWYNQNREWASKIETV